MRPSRLAISASLLVIVTQVMATGSMRCGTTLVKTGDTKPQVEKKCGEPDFREIISGSEERRIEQWYYARGQGQFPRVLTFRGITLVDVEVKTR